MPLYFKWEAQDCGLTFGKLREGDEGLCWMSSQPILIIFWGFANS
jgi:hypothetical protein